MLCVFVFFKMRIGFVIGGKSFHKFFGMGHGLEVVFGIEAMGVRRTEEHAAQFAENRMFHNAGKDKFGEAAPFVFRSNIPSTSRCSPARQKKVSEF